MSTKTERLESLRQWRQELIDEQLSIPAKLEAIDRLMAACGDIYPKQEIVKIVPAGQTRVSASYQEAMGWKEKILFVVNKLGKADVPAIAQEIKNIEPNITLEKAKKTATTYTSILYNKGNGVLRADTKGNRYVYHL